MISGQYKGIRYAVRRSGNAVSYCSLGIRAGTRFENSFPSGTAHFTEHCLFKGTTHHSATTINSCLEKSGGDLNAYTTKEEIVLHATTLKEDLSRAVDLLLDIAFNATFPEDEIKVEKGVVLDEIASYKDSPADEIYDSFEEKLFKGSSLSRSILGTAESVNAITPALLREYHDLHFIPSRMCLSIVSPEDEKKVFGKIKRSLDKFLPLSPEIAVPAPASKGEKVDKNHFIERENKDDNEANCIIGGLAPSYYEDKNRFTTLLLSNMLGGPAAGSILGNILREKHGWVYNVECGYNTYSDSGMVWIMFGCEKGNVDKCKRVIMRELAKMREKPISDRRLAAAKRQIMGQNAIGMENGEALCLAMNRQLLSFGSIMPDSRVKELVNSVTAADIKEIACEIFNPEALSVLEYR